ncbi:hypothetical protein ENBRE01_2284 [Enteropsectra breve]|nr:hypothetical protein ENBRE01_2284 [Enteropsectra breve]
MVASSYYTEVILPIITGHIDLAITFLKSRCLPQRTMNCRSCAKPIKWSARKNIDGYVWPCHNPQCSKMKTARRIRDESIFEGGRNDLRKMIHMYYLWSIGTSAKDCIRLCGIGGNRVNTYYKFLGKHASITLNKILCNLEDLEECAR